MRGGSRDKLSREPSHVQSIAQVRAEYTSARHICANLEHRISGRRYPRPAGYLPPALDYTTAGRSRRTIAVRDYDVRFLDRVDPEKALAHLNLIHSARSGGASARQELQHITLRLYPLIAARFRGADLIENEYVIPYTTDRNLSEDRISNKGSILLDLTRRGFATPDFNLLTAGVYLERRKERVRCARDAIRNLEKLSGRRLGDPINPLLIAMRSAMPEYIPGFMPTYLNVGLTPDIFPGLPSRYGDNAASRIRLNNRKTILEALDPESFKAIEMKIRPDLSLDQNHALADRIEAAIERRKEALLHDPLEQVLFFLDKAYAYYETHFDALRNFMGSEIHYPALIIQRMVCSVIDEHSFAGVLYSRHPRAGRDVHLQYARTIYGEDLMTGRLRPREINLKSAKDARRDFPSVYHFWSRLPQLEEIFAAPVMVEFTGVHGTFTILQVNQAELSGVGMLTAVMDLYRNGKLDAARVRELIKPYHIRQIESDAIDPKSLHNLTPFCRGISVLPRSAVTGRLFFSGSRAKAAREERCGENIILAKARFTPTDAINMQSVDGICSLSPAAIHVVTAAQNLGIPALLNLEESGVRLYESRRRMDNDQGLALKEGDWVTISSRYKTLFCGRAVYAPARLLRYMNGERLKLTRAESKRFKILAATYRAYRSILESVEASEFKSLQDLGHAVRYGKLRDNPEAAVSFVNQCFDVNRANLVRRLFETTLGSHMVNLAAFELLSVERKVQLLKDALDIGRRRRVSGYQAGAFVIGSLVRSDAPVAFWRSFDPCEIALLINEWVLHQKYLDILNDVGERRISRAEDTILSQGLGTLRIHNGMVSALMPLKLSGVDLNAVKQALVENCDSQTMTVLDMLMRPFGEFYDYSQPWSLSALRRLCAKEGVAVPPPEAV